MFFPLPEFLDLVTFGFAPFRLHKKLGHVFFPQSTGESEVSWFSWGGGMGVASRGNGASDFGRLLGFRVSRV